MRLAIPVLAVGGVCAVARADITATFDAGAQGWQVFNVGMSGHVGSPTPLIPAPWEDVTQSLRVTDVTGETTVGPPTSWLGNRSSLYGHSLSFDAIFRTEDAADYSAVVLAGATITLYYPATRPPLNAWFRRVVPLSEGGWHVNADNGAVATQAQVQGVLADLRGIFIRTEWKTGSDDTNIDNVVLGGASLCPADLDDGSGTGTPDAAVDINDLLYFLAAYEGGGLAADLDDGGGGGTPDGAVTIDDLLFFLAHYEGGC